MGEVLLWQEIRKRKLGYQFHRQVPLNKYIVDFFCHELLLAIEIDGGSHDHPEIAVSDLERQNELEELGIRFLRFEEKEVRKNVQQVIEVIEKWIEMNNESGNTPPNQTLNVLGYLPSRGDNSTPKAYLINTIFFVVVFSFVRIL